jgi:diacylglycerol kinase family enzyme
MTRPGAAPVELALALVCNADPWTYLGERPVRPCPEASFDTGLDLFGLTSAPPRAVARHLSQILAKDGHPHGKRVVALHDVDELVLSSAVPLPFQLDGDDVGDRDRVVLRAVPGAVEVLV